MKGDRWQVSGDRLKLIDERFMILNWRLEDRDATSCVCTEKMEDGG